MQYYNILYTIRIYNYNIKTTQINILIKCEFQNDSIIIMKANVNFIVNVVG